MEKLVKILSISFGILGTITLPVTILILGIQYNQASTDRQAQGDYTRLAVRILMETGDDSDGAESRFSDDEIELRSWAVELLNDKSPVVIPTDVKETIVTGKTPLPYVGGYANYDFGASYDYGGYDVTYDNPPPVKNAKQEVNQD